MSPEDAAHPNVPAASTPRPAARVQAVVLVRDGRGLEETLASLSTQTWPELSVVVVDTGQADVDPGPAVRRHGAGLVHAPGGIGEAAHALFGDAGYEGEWRLFCEDGVVLEPEAVRLLIETAESAGAGVAGPKLVDKADPAVLVEVGLSADRFGVAFTPLDPGEIDHGQHDGTREVLFVSARCMAVRADLFARLDGFDPVLGDDGFDLDLCWRARILDGPVLVVPEARVAVPARAPVVVDQRVMARHRLRIVAKCYSFFHLVAVLGQLAALGAAEMAALTLARRGREARHVAGAWWWNLRHLLSTLRLRWRTQRRRTTPDSVVRRLQVTGSSRVREYLESRIEQRDGGPLSASGRGDHLTDDLRSAAARPQVVFWLVTLAVALAGARALLVGALPESGQMLIRAPERGLLGSYLSPWRFDALGSAAGGPIHLVLVAMVRLVGLGSLSAGFRVLLVGGYVAGLSGVWRVVSRLDPWPAPAVAVVVYGLSPVLLAATEAADLGAFWMWCLTPFLFARLLDSFDGLLPPVASTTALALLLALATSLFPLAPLVVTGSSLAVLVGSLLVGRRGPALAAVVKSMVASAVAVVLLMPASLQTLGLLGGRGGLRPWYLRWPDLRVALGAGEAIRLQVGWVGGGVAAAAPALFGLFALAVGRRQRLEWAVRLWPVALVGMAGLFLAGQNLLPASPRLFPAAVSFAALALAALCGLAAGACRRDLPDNSFGWRHVAAAAIGAALVLGLVGPLGRTLRNGRLGLAGDQLRPATVFLEPGERGRVLWLGAPSSLPGDAYPLPGQLGSYVITNGLPDVGDILPAAPGPGDAALAQALDLVRDSSTQRGGRLLAPFGIRWVVLVAEARPARVAAPPPDPNLVTGLDQQLDLAKKRVDPRLVVYENTSVLVGPVVLGRPDLVDLAHSSGPGQADALQATETGPSPPPLARSGDGFAGPAEAPEGGLLYLAETFDTSWTARSGGRELGRSRAFGWAQGFTLSPGVRGSVDLQPGGGGLRLFVATGQLVLWVAALVVWRRARPERDLQAVVVAEVPDWEPVASGVSA